MKQALTRIAPLLGAAVILTRPLLAQEATPAEARETTPPEIQEPPPSPVSGTLSFEVNSHFILYGLDVWSTGSSWRDPLFNPSFP